MNTFDVYYEKGVAKGREERVEQGMEKGKIDVVRNLIVKLGFTDEQAAEVTEVSIDFVIKVRSSLKKG